MFGVYIILISNTRSIGSYYGCEMFEWPHDLMSFVRLEISKLQSLQNTHNYLNDGVLMIVVV